MVKVKHKLKNLNSIFLGKKTDKQRKLNDKNEHGEKNKFEVKIIILKHTRPLRVSGPDVRFSFSFFSCLSWLLDQLLITGEHSTSGVSASCFL